MTRTRRARATVVATGSLALLLPAAAASAAAPTPVTNGTTTLRPTGAAYRTLKRADVAVLPIGVAATKGSRIAIPVRSGVVGTVSQLVHGETDGLLLRGEDGSARLTDLRMRIGRSSSTVTGRVDGGTPSTLFTLSTKRLDVRLASRAASRKKVTWKLTARGARTLRSRLGVRGLRAGGFGVATLTARLAAPSSSPSPAPGTPGSPTPSPSPVPAPLPPGAPATASIVSGTSDWGVKTSFRNYITGPIAGGKVVVSDGASTNADKTFRFGAATGTVDRSTGALSIGFRGTVYFEGHGSGDAAALRVWIRNPRVVTTAGATTGALHADMTSKDLNSGRTVDYPDVRVADLDLTKGTRTVSATGVTWDAVPATLTEAGSPAFGGFYNAGAELDPISFAVTTTG
ncbi:HtaA domain-containing protein [Patulibacter sp.]|uniref:HtaA domain-containing protein n=1 Tax=Patulibacter sp. TaxID=1912859 RepID=UPI00271CDED2|nr:HtaA domain-containing protein [Patulibacter sp.]MDO9410261.1 HtaA domain-containing protein [Patulibacter sp.]